jgi:hypothetical protein
VDQREYRGVCHRKQGHCFGKTVDGGSPLLIEQQKDRRDQRSSMADTDPPNEVNDRECPSIRLVGAPDPNTF